MVGIRAINMWIRDAFWPWYKEYELGLKVDYHNSMMGQKVFGWNEITGTNKQA